MPRNISTRFRHIGSPNLLLEIIDEKTAQLQTRYPRIRNFSIVVDKPRLKRQKKDLVRVQVAVSLPRNRVFVSKEADGMTETDNALTALQHAFDVAEANISAHIDRNRYRHQRRYKQMFAEIENNRYAGYAGSLEAS